MPKKPDHVAFQKLKEAPVTLKYSASFQDAYNYYLKRAKLSEYQLSKLARVNQSRISKIVNGGVKNVDVTTLTCMCLVLQLSKKEAKRFLALRERAFSPANETHKVYLKIIRIYSAEKPDYNVYKENPEEYLVKADNILIAEGKEPLPIMDLYSRE